MNKFLAAVAVAAALSSGAAWAQAEVEQMTEGLSMLESAVATQFTMLGITDVDPMSLSLSQLAQIKSVLGSSEENVNDMKRQVEAIIARN